MESESVWSPAFIDYFLAGLILKVRSKSLAREKRIQIPVNGIDMVDVELDWVEIQFGIDRSQTRWHPDYFQFDLNIVLHMH